MFMGEFEHSLDEKGRLAIPARFRSRFADGLVITRGLDRCLFVYTLPDWRSLADKLGRLPLTKADARAFSRMLFSGAMECQLDSQGRIVVPSYLRQYAGLSGVAVILGVNNRLEIWDKGSWETTRAMVEEQGGQLAEQLASLGLV